MLKGPGSSYESSKKVKSGNGNGNPPKRHGAQKRKNPKQSSATPAKPVNGYLPKDKVITYYPNIKKVPNSGYLNISKSSPSSPSSPYYSEISEKPYYSEIQNLNKSHYSVITPLNTSKSQYQVGKEVHPFGKPAINTQPKTKKNTRNSIYQYLTNKGAQSGTYSARLARINPDRLSKLSGDAALDYLKDNFTSTKALEIKNFFDSELKGANTVSDKKSKIEEILSEFKKRAKNNRNTRTRIIKNISNFNKRQSNELEQRERRIKRSMNIKKYLEEQNQSVSPGFPEYGPGKDSPYYKPGYDVLFPNDSVYADPFPVSSTNMNLEPKKTRSIKQYNPPTEQELINRHNSKLFTANLIKNAEDNAKRIADRKTNPNTPEYHEMVKNLTKRIKMARGLNTFNPSKQNPVYSPLKRGNSKKNSEENIYSTLGNAGVEKAKKAIANAEQKNFNELVEELGEKRISLEKALEKERQNKQKITASESGYQIASSPSPSSGYELASS